MGLEEEVLGPGAGEGEAGVWKWYSNYSFSVGP